MALMMLMSRSRKIMGQFQLPMYLQVMGWAGTVGMFAASIAFLVSSVK
jgi:Mn2+/Fe2+ NRAMP family transporter